MTGCASFGAARVTPPTYPELPADLRICFETEVPRPAQGPLTKKQTIALIGALKKSETQKTACGTRLVAFYDNLSGN